MKETVPYLKQEALHKHFLKHCVKARVRSVDYYGVPTDRRGFYKVVKPIHVFKKVYFGSKDTQAIANLIIPVGAMVYADSNAFEYDSIQCRKMRATEAQVVSIYARKSQKVLKEAQSGYYTNFKYVPGTVVKPLDRFCKEEDQCASGIHFFINLADALSW